MQKKHWVIILVVSLFAVLAAIFQYVANFRADFVSAYTTGKPLNGHLWSEMECSQGLCVTSNYKVGIGMDNPTAKLEVNGTVKANDFCLADGSTCLSQVSDGGGDGCGIAAKTYAADASSFGSDTFCKMGWTVSPANPAFPSVGGNVTWTCTPSISGVAVVACVASRDSTCGTVTFSYNGSTVTYGTVLSPTRRCWLDRNLGAEGIGGYGDLFQWGRGVDGHQSRSSSTSSTRASSYLNPGSSFITDSPVSGDWLATRNDSLWQGVSGVNNPCPSGYRLPTISEWNAEISAGGWSIYTDTEASSLKLPTAGYRNGINGNVVNSKSGYTNADINSYGPYILGGYWTSTVHTSTSIYDNAGPRYDSWILHISYTSGSVGGAVMPRDTGFSVRCIKD